MGEKMHKYTLKEVEIIARIMEIKFINFSAYDLQTGINYEMANFICYNEDNLDSLRRMTGNIASKLKKYPNYYIDKMI